MEKLQSDGSKSVVNIFPDRHRIFAIFEIFASFEFICPEIDVRSNSGKFVPHDLNFNCMRLRPDQNSDSKLQR